MPDPDVRIETGPGDCDQTFVIRGLPLQIDEIENKIKGLGLKLQVLSPIDGLGELRLTVDENTPYNALATFLDILRPNSKSKLGTIGRVIRETH